MRSKAVKQMIIAAVIAASYAAATLVLSAISYGPVQFRISEAFTILAAVTPAAVPGLGIGCFIANIFSPYGIADMVCGTAATLLAAIFGYILRNVKIKRLPIVSALMPVVFNAVIIGAEITFLAPDAAFAAFAVSALWVGLGELVVCVAIGLPLYVVLNKSNISRLLK